MLNTLKKTCKQCGKKGIFLEVDASGLCHKCTEANKAAAIEAAVSFINDFVTHIDAATMQPVIFPGLGRDKIHRQREECQYVLNHIDDWKTFPYFIDAFKKTLVQDTPHTWYRSPLFRRELIMRQDDAYCNANSIQTLFDGLKKVVGDLETKCAINELKAYDYSKIYQVVGVTFKNGRRTRQAILRKLRFGDPPYGKQPDITLEQYFHEDELAVGVFVNGDQAGNISRDDLPWLLEHWDDYVCVSEFDVTGGGPNFNYGLIVRVGFCGSES